MEKEHEKLKNYFLSVLPTQEAEEIELEIITDKKFADRLENAEQELMESYLENALSKDEIKLFETKFLITKERRERLEFLKNLKEFAKIEALNPSIKDKPPSFFELLKNLFKPRRLALTAGGLALILTIGYSGYFLWKSYSGKSEILISLDKAYKNERPTEARITDFEYAPKTEGTRGTKKDENLDLVAAKSRAAEAVLRNETAENLHELGRVYLAENNFDEAVKQFEKAVGLNPNIAKIHNDLAVAYLEKGKLRQEGGLEFFAKANEEIEKAIGLDGQLTEAYFNRGLVIEALKLPNQAKEAWQNYLKLDATSPWADEARKHLQNLEKTQPIGKTKEEILQEFLQAKQSNDRERAWEILSRNREMITGKLIPQQLAFLFVDAATAGDEAKTKEALDAMIYIGNLETEKSGDVFWKDLAGFYSTVSPAQFTDLKSAQDAVRQGYLMRNQRFMEKSQTAFESAKEKFAKIGNQWEEKICDFWIANNQFQLNKVEESNKSFFELADFARSRNYFWLATQAFIRLAYGIGVENKVSKAIESSKSALGFAEKTQDLYDLQRIYSLLAEDYGQLKRFDLSLLYSEKSLKINLLPEASQRQRWADYDSATRIFAAKRYFKTAVSFQKEALELSKIVGEKYFEQGSSIYLAAIYSHLQEFDKSEELLKNAVKLAETFDDEQIRVKMISHAKLKYANLKRQRGQFDESVVLYREANEFYAASEFQYEKFDGQKGLLLSQIALKDGEAVKKQLPVVMEIFRSYRAEIIEEQSRDSFFDKEQNIYDIAVDFEFEKGNYAEAFAYTEESRARSLLDIQNSFVNIAKNEDKPEVLFSANVSQPQNLPQIQSQMPENIQLLEYAVLDDKIIIWLIKKDGLNVVKKDFSAEKLGELVTQYIEILSKNSEPEKQKAIGKTLYETLISPIRENLDGSKEVFIIPDKILFRLPFATLSADKYLIEDFAISFAPSANVFLNCSKKANELGKNKAEKILSVGNPSFNQNDFENKLQSLPAAKEEASAVAGFYDNSFLITEKDATKNRFNENIKNAEVVHFGGHYVVDENSPLLSGLVLAGINKEESLLRNHEIIAQKNVKTRLIVLSACQTGVEGYFRGEGMIGASRTFLATGIPLVVASQWAVDSEATRDLMIRFHNLRSSGNFSTVEALRQAQIEMLKGAKYNQPYFWSAFLTIGGYARF